MTKIDLRFCHKILPNGLPKGYEFVRFGFAKQGELYLGSGDENCKVIVRNIDEPDSNVGGDKVNKIEGLLEGWELVRIGTPVDGERYIASDGGVVFCMGMGRSAKNYVIVRKIEPPKPLVIEAGKFYRLRNGSIIGPIDQYRKGDWFKHCGSFSWSERGTSCDGSDALDIVAEVPPPEPPKPKYIPWTYETCPVGCVVVDKTAAYKVLVIAAGRSIVWIGLISATYDTLLNDYTQLDGTPCGTIEP